ncbi:MAG TPA: riboflavin biosynthesis protein RibF [Gaiellaceae bacterium]|nr:riboflavin biosynthesis protein RibF [Gaiellaceae bacterium]
MKVARAPEELHPKPRAVALGTFDGVHLGHRRVLEAAREIGLTSTVVTFHPHPRTALGNFVSLLSTLDRRLELIAEAGVDETVVVEFTLDLARLEPGEFADRALRPLGTEVVVAGEDFRFGHGRKGDLDVLAGLGFEVRPVPLLEGVSSTRIRELIADGAVEEAAGLLGRPVEVEGTVVAGNARGGTLGFPTANLAVQPELVVPAFGIYAGSTLDHRAAISIGTNPHYGGRERRIEAFVLDFEGDLYGRELIVEVWRRLRDEQAFSSEEELVAQIAHDVEETRRTEPPAPVTDL